MLRSVRVPEIAEVVHHFLGQGLAAEAGHKLIKRPAPVLCITHHFDKGAMERIANVRDDVMIFGSAEL